MKKINYLYIILLTIFSCTNSDFIISKQVENWNLDYYPNLIRTNSGINKTSASISWNPYIDYSDFNYYKIEFNDTQEELIDSSISNYTIELSPGGFSQLKFSIYNDANNIIVLDSIQVHSRVVEPINNLNYSVDGTFTYNLSWEPSTEIDFDKYIIYRSIDPSLPLDYVNPDSCNNLNDINLLASNNTPLPFSNNCVSIDTLTNQLTSSYIDEPEDMIYFSYIITTFDINGLYRNSTIKTTFSESAEPIDAINASNSFTDKIRLEWENIETPSEFYTIDIWRGTSSNVNDNENHTKIATIFDPNQTYFEDRNNIGSSTSWYYMLKITNIYGRYSKSPDDIHGITQP